MEPTTEAALEAIFGVASVELSFAIGRQTAIHYGLADKTPEETISDG